MPNFKSLAKSYEKNATLALQELVHCPSVYDPKSIGENAPYGAGVKKALDYVGKLGQDYGFKVDYCHGHATEVSFGEEGPIIGIYAHADVVPVSGQWDNPPFSAAIKGEGAEAKMFGRGTSDDKGPLIAALFACKLLKDNGLIKGFKVRLVAGGDEERGSSCLDYYFHQLKKEDCAYGFTPDADFPLIYAEKGIVHEEYPNEPVTALIDYNNNVVVDALVLAKHLGHNLKGIRVDTSKALIDHYFDDKDTSGFDAHGVCKQLIYALRKALNEAGFNYVKIIVSSGFTAPKIEEWTKEGVPVDMYGVGTTLVDNTTVGFTGDLVMLDGKPEAKEGRHNVASKRLKKVPYPIY